jgi:hypothetical protein
LLAVVAGAQGYSLADMFAYMFPRFRGETRLSAIPMTAYTLYFAYVIAAAEIAILYRRSVIRRYRDNLKP